MPEHDVSMLDLDCLRGVVVYLKANGMPSLADAVFAAINEIRDTRKRPARDDRPAGPPLIELPGGAWIDPRDVRGIIAMESDVLSNGETVPDRVVVARFEDTANYRIPFGSLDEACDYASRLGRQVNAARAGKAEGDG